MALPHMGDLYKAGWLKILVGFVVNQLKQQEPHKACGTNCDQRQRRHSTTAKLSPF